MASEGMIVGRVCSAGGQPISDATVLIASGPSHADIASLTDDDGRYVIGGVKPGAYTVRASAPNFESGTKSVLVSGQGEYRADFRLTRQLVEEAD